MKQWSCARALRELRALGEQRNIDGMARFGIRAKVVYGVAKPKLDLLARRIGKITRWRSNCGRLECTMRGS